LSHIKTDSGLKEKTITIGMSSNGFFPNLACSLGYIEITLPIGYAPNIKIENEFGVIGLGNIAMNSLEITQNWGEIHLLNIVAKSITSQINIGNIVLNNVVTNKITTKSPSFTVDRLSTDELKIESESVNIKYLYLLRNQGNYIIGKSVQLSLLTSSNLNIVTESLSMGIERGFSGFFSINGNNINIYLPNHIVKYQTDTLTQKSGTINGNYDKNYLVLDSKNVDLYENKK
jgi:hypothetical protein